MSENNALDIVQEIIDLHVQFPNDMEFGNEVRRIVWERIHKDNPTY